MTSTPRPSSHPSDTRAADSARLADPGSFGANGFNAAPAIRPSAWLVATGAAAIGTIGRALPESTVGIHLLFYLAFPVVTIAAWYDGFQPGMFAIVSHAGLFMAPSAPQS